MGNKSKRPGTGKQSQLVADVAASIPNALAVLVEAAGGALDISYSDLVASAENINLQVTAGETHLQLRTVLKPQVARQVREGPAGIPLLGGPVELHPPASNGDEHLGSDMPSDSQGAQEDGCNQPEPPTSADSAEPE